MTDPIINKVAESGLLSLDLETYYPKGETDIFDLKDHLFMGMILKEKEFRQILKDLDWEKYRERMLLLHAVQMLLFLCGHTCLLLLIYNR